MPLQIPWALASGKAAARRQIGELIATVPISRVASSPYPDTYQWMGFKLVDADTAHFGRGLIQVVFRRHAIKLSKDDQARRN